MTARSQSRGNTDVSSRPISRPGQSATASGVLVSHRCSPARGEYCALHPVSHCGARGPGCTASGGADGPATITSTMPGIPLSDIGCTASSARPGGCSASGASIARSQCRAPDGRLGSGGTVHRAPDAGYRESSQQCTAPSADGIRSARHPPSSSRPSADASKVGETRADSAVDPPRPLNRPRSTA